MVPNPPRLRVHRDAEAVPAMIGAVLRDRELLRLDFGIFALHAMLTASFLVVPGLLHGTLDVPVGKQWMVYLPVLLLSVVVMVPAIIVAEKYRRMKGVFVGAVAALLASQLMLYFGAGNLYVLLAALLVFFSAFNVMEASLPSLITKAAPADAKGTAMGLYSSLQFLGIFAAAWSAALPISTAAMPRFLRSPPRSRSPGCVAAATMAQPSYLTTRLIPIADGKAGDAGLAAKLRQVPGVAEAVVIAEDKLAYLKVDSRAFDAKLAASLAGAP